MYIYFIAKKRKFLKVDRGIYFKGCRMGRSDKVSFWYVALAINTRFRFFLILE